MMSLRAALTRLRSFFANTTSSDEVREELNLHLDMAIAENVRRGMDPDQARRAALIASGGMTAAVEAVRAQRGLPWLERCRSRSAIRRPLAEP